MRFKMAYHDKIVEVSDKVVYLFKGRLYSAPLEEVVNYYLRGEGLLAPPLKAVAADIVRVIMNSRNFEGPLEGWKSAGQGVSI